MNKKILSLSSLGALALPVIAFGQVTIATMAESIATQVLVVGTWIVVIMWVVTGILFLTAQGEPGKINTAKTSLFAAIGGTILIILANGAIAFVKNSFGI
ncbi:MAG: hypothetical protein A2401_00065 [Candidatus Staskawiczbacteria bacterium RIFOXYC1_FULL_38_18]|uniref:Uncharacterized protein n=1 Tax=Candidatus Staskawiczbacteria bacterium RIFOXYC1_FULL_38_18 TaxID=1802229 RepID=A0A1G2JCZ8_9BACT|nr:MAG: hypothetical protein A2401_00065 [Candidatus Staskawiczbacteria bacterium RIFOXYC1_FULL_38_18]